MLARLALLTLFTSTAYAAAPLEAYGNLPAIENAALSPNGAMLALEQTSNGVHLIVLVSLDEEKVISGLRVGDQKIRAIQWADNDHVLLTTASTAMPFELIGEKTEWHLLSSYDVREKKLRPLLDHVHDDARAMNVVNGSPVIEYSNGETLLFVHGVYVESQTLPALFRINVGSPGTELEFAL